MDLSILFSALASMFILFALLAFRPKDPQEIPEPAASPKVLYDPRSMIPSSANLTSISNHVREYRRDLYYADLEEAAEYSAVFYACVPIGRYYITAYNHKETGSKQTASGATCHEGTITTCAADPRYHRFGEILEIDGRLYIVEDTGSAVKKKHIDLYFASYSDMAHYNTNYQTVYRVEFPFGKPSEF